MTESVFVGTSVDGFIARPNGDFDFLPPGGGEPHGYEEFIATVDALVIGRKTFETVLKLAEWPYGNKRVVVLSSRSVDLSAARGAIVEQMSGRLLRLFRNSELAVRTTFILTEGLRFKGSCAQGSSSDSQSPEFPCSSATEFLSSAR